ncbi:MAG: tetratricopeptide repeat protein, partial [Chloroflexota bacterium]|nr:tetratricopeptide repeat protein [Chloroflexota bacterium]
MSQVKLFVFGPPRVERDSQVLEINLRKVLALLIYLAVTKQPRSRDALATLLWPESDRRRARGNLRRTLYQLNKALGDEVLQATAETVELNPLADVWLDVEAFQEHVTECLPDDHPTSTLLQPCLDYLTEAAQLYSDDFLAGFTLPDCPEFDEWQFFEREGLRRTLGTVLVQLVHVHQTRGEWEVAIDQARRWLTLDPLHEPAHRQLMRLYALAGQQAAALRQYNECVRLLDEELGVAPEAETRELYEAVRAKQLPTVVRATPEPVARRATIPQSVPQTSSSKGLHRLPQRLTSFVGREKELAEIAKRLNNRDCRLLTLVGPGGIGKTRLAIEVARQQAEHFPHGIYWIDLQPVQSVALLVTAIADAFSLSSHDNPRQQLLHYLQDKTLLLILDNFEQLLEGADFLIEMLQHGARIKLLVTSREALNLQEEWLFPVRGLSYPQVNLNMPDSPSSWAEIETYDAVRLLVERVRQVRPDFSPSDEQNGLLRICQLVEGMPLALELAGSWTKGLDCATIADEIQRNLAFLTSNLRNVPERHRSMQAVFAHSWALLTPAEQDVFQQLAVFRGGFRREAVEVVTGATLPVLTALVDKSLLRWEADGRYQIHELLRQYAEQQLVQSSQKAVQSCQRHAVYYTDFLYRRTDAMLGGRQREAADEIAPELENIRAAWQWAVQHGMVDAIGRAIEPLSMFCHMQGKYLDAARMFDDALHNLAIEDPSTQPVKALVLLEVGWIAIRLGQFDKAEKVFRQCHAIYQRLDLLPLPGLGTDPLLGLSTLASIHGDYAEAQQLAQQACETAATQNHLHNHQNANQLLANVAYAQGEYEKAQAYAEAAYEAAQRVGDRWFMAYALNELGQAARALGDYAAARRHFEASYASREAFSDPEGMALAMNRLGDIALRQQQFEEAQQLYEESVAIYRKINDKGGLAAAYQGLGTTAVAQGDFESAQQQFRQALQIAADIQFTSLLLTILASISEFLLATGRMQQGFPLLTFVQQHPATEHETRMLVQRQVQHCQAAISPAQTHAARQGQPDDLTTAIAMAQAELSAELSQPAHVSYLPAPPSPGTQTMIEPLTDRELEVLHLLAQGMTNRQTAEALSVVLGTVKAHN